MNKKQNGFGVIGILIVIVIVGLLGFTGWYVWQQNRNNGDSSDDENTQSGQASETDQNEQLSTYTIDNEGLTFSYNPAITTVDGSEPERPSDDAYVVRTKAITGPATLSITTGIFGIGGTGACTSDRDICEVVGTKKGEYLGHSVTYRLIKAQQVGDCGHGSLPSCEEVELTTSFFIDTYSGDDAIFGPCCGMISYDAKNLGGKAKVAGSVLVDIETDEAIQNEQMLNNPDVIETIKIIESFSY